MRWYDYVFCVIYADSIVASIFTGNIFLLTISVGGYAAYEWLRTKSF